MAIGPLEDPPMVEILEVDEDRQLYRTKGVRQVSDVIRFGAERFWIEAKG